MPIQDDFKPYQTLNVLLIEDHQDYADIFIQMLSKSPLKKFEVKHAQNLAEGKTFFEQSKPDIIITDLGLPESNGLDTLKKILEFSAETPVIVLTALDDYFTGLTAVKLGAQDYLMKTTTNKDLIIHSVLHAIERNHLRVELQRTNTMLEKLAMTDPLTGLFNRRGLEQILKREYAFKQRYGFDFYAMLIDLDDFKSINDSYGHSAGDAALQQIASRIKGAIRLTDYAARIGGDEFLILLAYTKEENINLVTERLRIMISESPLSLPDGKTVNITCSGGCIGVDHQNANLDLLIKNAGSLLKESKNSGKNRVLLPVGSLKKKKTG